MAVDGAPVIPELKFWLSPKKHPLSGPETQAIGLIPNAICGDC